MDLTNGRALSANPMAVELGGVGREGLKLADKLGSCAGKVCISLR
jgi:hypothetical protein